MIDVFPSPLTERECPGSAKGLGKQVGPDRAGRLAGERGQETETILGGFIAPGFDMQELDLQLLEKSRAFLAEQARAPARKPFFLYHATQAVHLPSFAGKDFQGKSGVGPHGDFLAEFDYVVGELMRSLEQNGLADNTLVLLSSDNGPETTAAIRMRADHGHDAARPWRGVKRDAWEGGHRVPLIVRWPGRVKPVIDTHADGRRGLLSLIHI